MECGPTVFSLQSLEAFLIELGNIKCARTFCQLFSKWCVAELRMRTAAAENRVPALAQQCLKVFK